MHKGRPRFGFFIFDCPSDHEVDGSLPTESDVIRGVLANRKNLKSRIKVIKCSTAKRFRSLRKKRYIGIRYVHVGGHGSKKGLGFIGGTVKWPKVAKKLTTLFPQLEDGEERILTLSCCYSEQGIAAMKQILQGHFSAAYHFVPDEIGFSKAITTWSMFYHKKGLKDPREAIRDKINDFMDEKVIRFVLIKS